MKLEMIKEGPIEGIIKKPGEVIEVDGELGQRLIEFKFARVLREQKSGHALGDLNLRELHNLAKEKGVAVKGLNAYKGDEGKLVLIRAIEGVADETGNAQNGGKEDSETDGGKYSASDAAAEDGGNEE